MCPEGRLDRRQDQEQEPKRPGQSPQGPGREKRTSKLPGQIKKPHKNDATGTPEGSREIMEGRHLKKLQKRRKPRQ